MLPSCSSIDRKGALLKEERGDNIACTLCKAAATIDLRHYADGIIGSGNRPGVKVPTTSRKVSCDAPAEKCLFSLYGTAYHAKCGRASESWDLQKRGVLLALPNRRTLCCLPHWTPLPSGRPPPLLKSSFVPLVYERRCILLRIAQRDALFCELAQVLLLAMCHVLSLNYFQADVSSLLLGVTRSVEPIG